MPRIFDNIDLQLLPILRETLKVSYRSDFCVGYFNLRGWRKIDDLIEQYVGNEKACCRLLIGMQSRESDEVHAAFTLGSGDGRIDNSAIARYKKQMASEFRQQLTIGAPTNQDEAGLRRLSYQLKTKKLIIKLFLRHPLHAKLYLVHRQDPNAPIVGFLGSSNLTLPGLAKQGELNVDILDHDACNKLQKWFDDRWQEYGCIDISKELAEIIDESWAREKLIPPYHIYLKIAYHLSHEAIAGLSEFRIPREFNNLFDFQKAAVQLAARHVTRRGGVLVGDVVGLGKTLVGTALAKILQEDCLLETLIICPKNLVQMWQEYVDNYKLYARVLPISKVLVELPKLRRYRVVLIDESHNLRNREGKRYRAIAEYINANESKCILLSATPYNKTYLDLSSQLRLFVPEDQDLGFRPEALINELGELEFTRRHQCSVRSLAAFEKSEYSDDWRELMKRYMVRRTRSFIKDNYAHIDATGRKYLEFADGSRSYFPDRIPRTIKFTLDSSDNDVYSRLYSESMLEIINQLNLPRYGLGNYIITKHKQPPTETEQRFINALFRGGRRLMGFSRTNLFKRLESSGIAFLQSIERHILRNFIYLYALKHELDLPIGTQDAELLNTSNNDEDTESITATFFDTETEDDIEESSVQEETDAANLTEQSFRQKAELIYTEYATRYQRRFRWLRSTLFDIKKLKRDLLADAKALINVLQHCGEWNSQEDKKFAALVELLTKTHPKDKILIFTQFADTVRYLTENLQAIKITHVAGVTGQSKNPTELTGRFSPVSNGKGDRITPSQELRVLIATDILSEGHNLQDCAIIINWDLPWAIIRLIQRAGRVDRIGQKAENILCYSFLPAEGVERIINLRGRLRQRLQENAEVVGTDEAFFYVKGINNETDRRWYTSVLLNRLMFVYFLQRKGFIDNGDLEYLPNKLKESKQRGENRYYHEFLQALFFESFAKPEEQRNASVQVLVGKVRYLNGGLFLQHRIEQEYKIDIADEGFERVLDLFARYSWNLDDTPEGNDDEINPDVLGYIFEKYINQKAFGAYYTRPQITEYLCDRTIHKLIVDKVNEALSHKYKSFEDINELLIKLDTNICSLLIDEKDGILPNLSILDPACGSGAFLVAAMKTLILVYAAVIGTIELQGDSRLKDWLNHQKSQHLSIEYLIKKRIVTNNLYGVDIMEEATEIAKLRLFLALVSSAHKVEELEPLPNIDFNIMAGNSLIGLIRVDETAFDVVKTRHGGSLQGNLLQPLAAANYKAILEDKNKSIELYKKHAFIPGEEKLAGGDEGTHQDTRLLNLRRHIEQLNQESQEKLNFLLLNEFSQRLGIKYEEVQLNGKSKKRLLTVKDIAALKPFHWGYHFDKVLKRGGFDAIITNPPWEIFKPQAKEFFAQHNELVMKNKMDIKTFEKEQNKLLQKPEIAAAWLEYQSQYPYVSAYYRSSEDYKNQISIVNGKKAGTDINLYKLFVERCFHLLRDGGECGIVIPSGIYTDLGTKQLREMLFSQTKVTGLFCLENRKEVFEGVHRSFKIVVLTFAKGGKTTEFPSAFMRLDVQELERFPSQESLRISFDMVRKLSPDSLSVMEFKNEIDVRIAEKMLRFPLLGEKIDGKWNLRLTREFDMTNDSHLFKQQSGKGRIPLYEGKMIHQFTHQFAEPRYWVDEQEGRKAILGRNGNDNGQKLDYQNYRLGFRDVASSTNERTMISGIIPPNLFAGNTLIVSEPFSNQQELLSVCAVLNSFACDFVIRQKVTAHCNMFYVYQLPIPRLTQTDRHFTDIVERAAKLICTTPEFDELAQETLNSVETRNFASLQRGVTDETDRAKLRAELDGIVAHLYGLTEEEFTYILSTFPIVSEQVKQDALEAYRTFAPMTGDAEIVVIYPVV